MPVLMLGKASVRAPFAAATSAGPDGRRPSDGPHVVGPLWTAHPTFSEYFHGDTGEGLGASHQTGWTALVAYLLCR